MSITAKEMEEKLWSAYQHGYRVARGEVQGPDPHTKRGPNDPAQPGNETPNPEPQPMKRADFVREVLGEDNQ